MAGRQITGTMKKCYYNQYHSWEHKSEYKTRAGTLINVYKCSKCGEVYRG